MHRFAASLRGLRDPERKKRPPHRALIVGDAPGTELLLDAYADAVDPTERSWPQDEPELLTAVLSKPPERRRRLVTYRGLPAATPETLAAIRGLVKMRGTWLVCITPEEPDVLWAEAFGECTFSGRISPTEALSTVQAATHLNASAAEQLVARCAGDPSDIVNAVACLRLVSTEATARDLDSVVLAHPGRTFAAHLLACRYREAQMALPYVDDVAATVRSLLGDVLVLWSMAEQRPPVTGRTTTDVADTVGISRDDAVRLTPLVRRYSRSKVRNRLEALGIAQEALRGGNREGVLAVLVAMWQ